MGTKRVLWKCDNCKENLEIPLGEDCFITMSRNYEKILTLCEECWEECK